MEDFFMRAVAQIAKAVSAKAFVENANPNSTVTGKAAVKIAIYLQTVKYVSHGTFAQDVRKTFISTLKVTVK